MATFNQRAISICDALVNGTATVEQRQRVLAAFGSAENFLRDIRRHVLGHVQHHEAQAGVASAWQAASASVDSGFTEQP